MGFELVNFRQIEKFQRQIAQLINSPFYNEYVKSITKFADRIREINKRIDFSAINKAIQETSLPESVQKSFEAFSKISEQIPKMPEINTQILQKLKDGYMQIAKGEGFLLKNCIPRMQMIAADELTFGIKLAEEDELSDSEEEKIEDLLKSIHPALIDKRRGAKEILKSDNPDKLSQASNSMVEILTHIYEKILNKKTLKEYLIDKYGEEGKSIAEEERKWIESIRDLMINTKRVLQKAKHKIDYKMEIIVETLLVNLDCIILLLLK